MILKSTTPAEIPIYQADKFSTIINLKTAKKLGVTIPATLLARADERDRITVHELATNAAKYGALGVPNGQVELKWSHDADRLLHLRWTESGGPKVQEPTHKGFGGRIIEQMIAQRSGKMHFDWRADGLVCEITLKV